MPSSETPVAPAVPNVGGFRDDVAAGEQVWRRLWFLMSCIYMTHLWCEKNDAIFEVRNPRSLPVSYTVGLRVYGNNAPWLCETKEAQK